MSRLFPRIVAALVCVSNVACSTLRTVPEWRTMTSSGNQFTSLKVGDEVRLTTVSSTSTTMTLTAIEPEAFVGTPSGAEQTVRIPFAQIVDVERNDFDGLKTTLLITLLAVAAALIALSNAAFMPGP